MTTDQPRAMEPVRHSVTVARPPDVVFRVFTERMADWWPLHTHSISADEAAGVPETVVVESREGGRIYERAADGTEHEWGRVLAWDPPRRFTMSWRPNLTEAPHTEVEVVFTAEPDGTRVDLEHREWERLHGHVEDPGAVRDGYRQGWSTVLGLFAERAGREAA